MSILRDAQLGRPEAQVEIAKLYLNGESGFRQDSGTAFYWLRKAAAAGNSEAQRLMGIGAASLAKDGQKTASPGADDSSPNADLALADWLLTGSVSPSEDVNAVEVLRRAARQGEKKAQLRLAILLQSGKRAPEELEEAVYWLQRAAHQGSSAAAARLADWYWDRFDSSAWGWLEKVAHTDEPEVLYRLAVMRASRGGSPKVSGLLAKAALREHRAALLYCGLLHASPLGKAVTGVAHSLKKAAAWLEKASHHGSAQASFELHRLFRLRQFSLKSAALAHRYLETAAAQGHAEAQYLLALASLRDIVGRDSDVAAATWLLRATKQGHAQAGAVARLLYAKTPPPPAAVAAEQARIIKMLARSRIALATRLELAAAFRLTVAELLLFDPEEADREDFIVLDLRRHTRRARRRMVVVDGADERSLLDRARRLLNARALHPTDVRGSLSQRRLDLVQSLMVLGHRPSDLGWSD